MTKPWVGYLSAAFLFLAGVLQLLGGSYGTGTLFLVLGAASVVLNLYISRHRNR